MKKEEYQPTEKLCLDVEAAGWWKSQPLLEKEGCKMACTEGTDLRKGLGGCGLLAGGKKGWEGWHI